MLNERQKQIREHLAKSAGGPINFQRSAQNSNTQNKSSILSSSQTSRKEHLEKSLGNYDFNFGTKQAKKSRILQHIRLTRG